MLFLSRRLPGRLTPEQAAMLLGFASHDITVLVRAGLLKPLGRPRSNAVKYFAASDIQQAAASPEWLAKATQAIYRHWERKNSRRSGVNKAAEPLSA
jgi:hypothetical protein